MANKQELEKLRKAIARERAKLAKTSLISKGISEKKRLQRKLFELKNPTASRIKRGFKVLAKKTGRGIMKQARLIKERQEREKVESNKRLKPIKRRKSSGGDPFSIFAPLDI